MGTDPLTAITEAVLLEIATELLRFPSVRVDDLLLAARVYAQTALAICGAAE